MRHAEISTTIRYYTDLGLADQAKAVARIPTSVVPALRPTGTDGPVLEANPARQRQYQQSLHDSEQSEANGCEGMRNSPHEVEINSSLEIAGVCDGLRTVAKGNEKAGEEDRTPDIQLGNLSAPPENTAENKVFPDTPSSIPSSSGGGIPTDLATVFDSWSRLPAAVRRGILSLVNTLSAGTPHEDREPIS